MSTPPSECVVDVRTFYGSGNTCLEAVNSATEEAQRFFGITSHHQYPAAVSTQLFKDGDGFCFVITVVRTLAI